MMTYEQACAFAKQAAGSGSILGLESICNLMEQLSNVQEKLPIIHIAGTNGKGSVGAYLASIFAEAGLHVARYTSPAVFTPLEVFSYDGKSITETEYADVMSQVKAACDIMVSAGRECPTIFEIETAVAFLWFYQKKPDIVLLETGMGGALDATNLIQRPLASVITSISMDHMQFLGNTIEDIAQAKAGIIKEGCPVYSASQKPAVKQVLKACAKERRAPIVFADESRCSLRAQEIGELSFTYETADGRLLELQTSLSGSYQVKNASLAAEAALGILPRYRADSDALAHIALGIQNARWPGRFEVISREPLFIIDGAHNEDAARQLARTVENCFTNTRLTYIIGVLADKEHEKMLQIMLPYAKRVYTVTPDNKRALEAEKLAREAEHFCTDVMPVQSVEQALDVALSHKEAVLAFGSLSYLGDIKRAFFIKHKTGSRNNQ